MDVEKALARLEAAARKFKHTEKAHKQSRAETRQAVLDALAAGARPTDVAERAPFSDSYMRRLVREQNTE